MKKIFFFVVLFFILCFSFIIVFADSSTTSEDVELSNGLDLGELLNLGSGVLAFILCVLTILAYNQSKNPRLIYVSVAFFLFSLNGFMVASQLILGDYAWIELGATFLNLIILLVFFFGIIKR